MYRNNAAWSPQSNEILLAHWVSAICLSVLLLLLKVNSHEVDCAEVTSIGMLFGGLR